MLKKVKSAYFLVGMYLFLCRNSRIYYYKIETQRTKIYPVIQRTTLWFFTQHEKCTTKCSSYVIDAMSFVKIGIYFVQAKVLAHSMHYQVCDQKKIGKKLHYYKATVKSWCLYAPIPVKLLTMTFLSHRPLSAIAPGDSDEQLPSKPQTSSIWHRGNTK